MVYEKNLEELERICESLNTFLSGKNIEEETQEILTKDFFYHVDCIILKENKISRNNYFVKKAEKLYSKGKIEEAENMLYVVTRNLYQFNPESLLPN